MLNINLDRSYCEKCGRPLFLREEFAGEFDKDTGKAKTIIFNVCPEYLRGRKKIRGFWGIFAGTGYVEHTRTRSFNILIQKIK